MTSAAGGGVDMCEPSDRWVLADGRDLLTSVT